MPERFTTVGEGKIEGAKLDPRKIVILEGFNYRDTTSPEARRHIEWLKESIKANGVQEPIKVKYADGEVTLVAGECRVIACRELYKEGVKVPYRSGGSGPPLIPALSVSGDEAQDIATSMIENGSLPPSKMEFGSAAKRLLALGWPKEKVALYTPPHIAKNGPSATRYVSEAVALADSPLPVKKALKEGVDGVKVSEGAALQAAKTPLHAERILKEQATEAKAKGKKTVRRIKGAGKATKAKEEQISRNDRLLQIGDRMADSVLALGEREVRMADSVLALGEREVPIALRGAAKTWRQLRPVNR